MLDIPLPSQNSALFLGKLNEEVTDIFLPDQKVFVYDNDALDDLPIVFDIGATISVTPNYRDFISYEQVPQLGIKNVIGTSQVCGKGMVIWII